MRIVKNERETLDNGTEIIFRCIGISYGGLYMDGVFNLKRVTVHLWFFDIKVDL